MQYLFRALIFFMICVPGYCFGGKKNSAAPAGLSANNVVTGKWAVRAEDGFILTDFKQKKRSVISDTSVHISIENSVLSVNGNPLTQRALLVESKSGGLIINDQLYTGAFMIYPETTGFSVCVTGSMDRVYDSITSRIVQESHAETIDQIDSVDYGDVTQYQSEFKVQVLLDECEKQGIWQLTSAHGFVVCNSLDTKKELKIPSNNLILNVRNGALYCNNKKQKTSTLYIKPVSGTSSFDERVYSGGFMVMRHGTRTLFINCVDLEEYVSCVLAAESWPGWPLEVNKVFAIACRTYVIAMAMRAKKTNRPYHVKNTNLHQTYDGAHNNDVLWRAVADTRGIYLTHNKKPIIAMFDACCGGVIPAHITDFDFVKAPYLAREYPCLYCKDCRLYSWQTEYDLREFEKHMAKQIKSAGMFKEVKVHKSDRAGLVQEVLLKKGKKAIIMTGKKMYSLLKDVKSYCFSVTKKRDKVIIKGRGYGHHLGICQWGARQMVRDGWEYQDILQFYYPGTDFMRVS